MPSLVRLELLREQGAQQLEDNPQHGRANESENKQEYQHNGGIDKELNHYPNPFLKEVSNHLRAYRA